MAASVRALLAGILDNAGIFPPANLPLDRAIGNYARHQKSRDRWMLGRFIVPAARLSELAAFDQLFDEDPPFIFSVLGRGGQTGDEFLQGVTADLADIEAFRQQHAGKVEVDVFEVKLPDEMAWGRNHHLARYTLVRAVEEMEIYGPPALTPFFEIALVGDWRGAVNNGTALMRYLASYGEQRMHGDYKHCRPAGFKLRCGGTQAAAFPTPEQVAHVIRACRDEGICLKATAGLHHPFRHWDNDLLTDVHGFINLFVAAVLALTHRLDEKAIQEIIEETDADHFLFEEESLRWRELAASVEEIAAARQQLAVGFGSCSFDEPREDLRHMHLL